MTDPKQLRVSDAEREHVVGLLQKAIGRGLITLDEFSERTDQALASRTRGELNAVLVDLPGMLNSEQPVEDVIPAQFGGAPRERVELKTTLSHVRRKGQWSVPRTIVVQNRMGNTDLDFREAHLPHPVVTIDLDVFAGSVRILLPEGSSVNTDDLRLSASALQDRVRFESGGRPHFVVTGNVKAGSVEIKAKRKFSFRNA
ncbi:MULTISPECIES: DUF1707 SHOCT-like domain-containing protein [Actinosynnema]|uniref:DUF1707 domain-containing protein n=1 Tax=Actinosynnema pretiosum TaxID=42197 RepID=A0A290ZHU7_9PSEU|nr:DUF1707 domain-containing protein [Actinosynnema pretiosum]ATE58559.1 hypothetical protein CNX65_34890 [Actinosynnema pretiosum]